MKFLANENLPLATILKLKASDWDVLSISLDSPSITDEEVMKIAIEENRTIITFDRDYGTLYLSIRLSPTCWSYLPEITRLYT